MKLCVILYHKDIFKIYNRDWVSKCLLSIRDQTMTDFHIYELCYGDKSEKLFPWSSSYYHIPMDNHIHAMNFILDRAFEKCDVVYNINLDDKYHPKRFELQLEAINEGFDLVSSDFQYIEEINGEDKPVLDMIFHDRNIGDEQILNHNVICHSSVAYTRKFWEENKYYDPTHLGFEDMTLWKKAVANNCKIKIIPEILCYYRLSPNQTSRLNPPKP